MCGYCGGSHRTECSRCGCRLCEAHASSSSDGWCWACAKELKDELDLVQFKTIITTPMEHQPDGSEAPMQSWMTLARWVATMRQKRTRRRVLGRSREEIDAWRRQVGIVTRW